MLPKGAKNVARNSGSSSRGGTSPRGSTSPRGGTSSRSGTGSRSRSGTRGRSEPIDPDPSTLTGARSLTALSTAYSSTISLLSTALSSSYPAPTLSYPILGMLVYATQVLDPALTAIVNNGST